MSNMHSFLQEFQDRGFFYQATDFEGINKYLSDVKNPSAYIGFDCTAPALHVGSLIQIMILRMLQRHKIRPIILLGGGTTKIGDPSGKDKTRQILTSEQIAKNKEELGKIFAKFVDFSDGDVKPIIIDNDQWLGGLKYIEFLREIGKHFSVNQMLRYESVKLRLEREQNLSFTEFNYMILQAYDFSVIKQEYDCRLQLGGSDQWGNITGGIELNRKLNPGDDEIFGLTTPLLTTADGKKMGKTESGAIWLNSDLLSPYEYFQFWRNIADEDVIRFLKLFTDIDVSQIAKYIENLSEEINQKKELLAFEATKICHGLDAAEKALQTAKEVFASKGVGSDLPKCEISQDELKAGIQFSALLAKTGLVATRGEAKRVVQAGGGRIEGIAYTDHLMLINEELLKSVKEDFKDSFKVSSGKKKHALIIIR